MSSQLFNTPFETGLRLLLLMYVGKRKKFSLEQLILLDFISCYSENFQLPYENLNGINEYMYGELSNRRGLAESAIKELAMDGFINIEIIKGYFYSITPNGRRYAKALKSSYAEEYQVIAEAVLKMYGKYPDDELERAIHKNAVCDLKEKHNVLY